MADEDRRARHPPERPKHAVDIAGVAVEAVLARDHLVALRPQRTHDLVKARTIGPQPVRKNDAGFALGGRSHSSGGSGNLGSDRPGVLQRPRSRVGFAPMADPTPGRRPLSASALGNDIGTTTPFTGRVPRL